MGASGVDGAHYFFASFSDEIPRAFSLAFHVTAADGVTPLNEVEVIAYKLHDYGYWLRDRDAMTQADGSYSIRLLLPGTYRISFSGPNGMIYAEEFCRRCWAENIYMSVDAENEAYYAMLEMVHA